MATRKLDKTKRPKPGDVLYEFCIANESLVAYKVFNRSRYTLLKGKNGAAIYLHPFCDLPKRLAEVELTRDQAKANAVKRITEEIKRLRILKRRLIPNCKVEVRE